MKKSVLVIFGGKSSEYEVSLQSATSVIKHISSDKYDTVLCGITKDGKWYLYEDDIGLIADNKWLGGKCCPAMLSPDFGSNTLIAFRDDSIEKIHIDVCFPVLHGKNGEDGTIQGLFEMAGMKYVGCTSIAGAMCMDKAVTNMTFDAENIAQAKWLATDINDYRKDSDKFINDCISYLGLPIFVKPANAGSSVGISKAKDAESLREAMEVAFKEDTKVVAEESIDGREIECAVLGNYEPVASVVGEVKPCNEFYDYNAKYIDGDSALYIPAELPEEVSNKVHETAVKAYKALGCKGLSRVDFFVRKSDNAVLLNEINTLPGFTSISMYPKLFEASGINYSDLVDKLITLAQER